MLENVIVPEPQLAVAIDSNEPVTPTTRNVLDAVQMIEAEDLFVRSLGAVVVAPVD